MDKTDEKILDLIKGNARMTYQEIGDSIGMTYVSGTSGDKEHKCMPSRFILPLMEK